MSTSTVINDSVRNAIYDFGVNPGTLGRLKLPYKSLNFLALLGKGYGSDKYDSASSIIELCRWMYFHSADVRNIIDRLAEYVITDVQIDDTNTKFNKDQQETLKKAIEQVGLKRVLVEGAKTFFASGNTFCSVETKFKKHLKCPKCEKFLIPIEKAKYSFDKKEFAFKSICYSCKYQGKFEVLDIKKRTIENIYIKLWDLQHIEFSYNPVTEDYRYYYKIPSELVDKLYRGIPDKHLLETTPQNILEEIFVNKRGSNILGTGKHKIVAFENNKLKHLKNNSINEFVMGGWGEPAIVSVLQDAFFMLLLRQAQGTLLADYIIPIRMVSPDPKVLDYIPLEKFSQEFDAIYHKFQRNPLQIMKIPYPVQYQTISGEAKQIFLTNEMEATRQSIRRGMGVPSELLDGGMQNYSSGAISLRMLENYFINFLNNTIVGLVNNFILPNICIILGIPPFTVNFVKFKMIDDVQQKQSMLELFDKNLIPDTTVYERYGIDRPSRQELNQSVEEKGKRDGIYQKTLAGYQAEAQSIMAERQISDQIKGQEMQMKQTQIMSANQSVDPTMQQQQQGQQGGDPNELVAPTGDKLPPVEQIGDYALNQLKNPEEIGNFISELGNSLPNNAQYVNDVKAYLQSSIPNLQGDSVKAGTKKSKIDKRPPPDQKPQRRENPV